MALPPGKCPRCGADLADMRMHGEYALVAPKDGRIRGSQRHFKGRCPEHGEVFAAYMMGHHSTQAAAHLKKRYPRASQGRILGRLTPHQRTRFLRALKGWIHPLPEDIKLWDHLVRRVWLSKNAEWLANVKFKSDDEK